jgi:hypothetical protein
MYILLLYKSKFAKENWASAEHYIFSNNQHPKNKKKSFNFKYIYQNKNDNQELSYSYHSLLLSHEQEFISALLHDSDSDSVVTLSSVSKSNSREEQDVSCSEVSSLHFPQHISTHFSRVVELLQ